MTIVINQSPWFDSFRKTVEIYEKETGNQVELDVNPFAGSLEKQRNSVRAANGQYDLLIMNSGWVAEMYFGGFVEPIAAVDPSLSSILISTRSTTPSISMPTRRRCRRSARLCRCRSRRSSLHKPPSRYGIVQRGARGPASVQL